MKVSLRACVVAAAVLTCAAAASADTFDSGVVTTTYVGYNTNNAYTNPAFDFSNMANLTGSGFTAAGSPTTVSIGTGGGVWSGPISGTSYISFEDSEPGAISPANGTYIFQTSFDDLNPAGGGTVSVFADDTTAIYLNGVLIPGTPAGTATNGKCTSGTPNCTVESTFELTNLTSGMNTLTFGVEQIYGSAMGVDFQVTTTPEPGSLVLLGTGLLGVAGAFRRRFMV